MRSEVVMTMEDYNPVTNDIWAQMMTHCVQGRKIFVRNRWCREIVAYQTVIPMMRPLMTVKHRKLSYRLAAAEALWILEGRNDVEFLAKYAPRYREFSDDGVTLYGAYGVRYKEQIKSVVDALQEDRNTRRAVMTTWIPNPRNSRDIPCTVSIQFLIRNDEFYTIVNMRSSDAWLGWPYDVFSFTMMSLDVILRLDDKTLKPGMIVLMAGSQHLYEDDIQKFRPHLEGCGGYCPMSIHSLNNPAHLRESLNAVCDMRTNDDIPQFFNDMVLLHKEFHEEKV